MVRKFSILQRFFRIYCTDFRRKRNTYAWGDFFYSVNFAVWTKGLLPNVLLLPVLRPARGRSIPARFYNIPFEKIF